MSAYVIVDIKVNDPTAYEEYTRLAAPTVTGRGGNYIARGGTPRFSKGVETKQIGNSRVRIIRQGKAMADLTGVRRSTKTPAQDCQTNMVVVDGV